MLYMTKGGKIYGGFTVQEEIRLDSIIRDSLISELKESKLNLLYFEEKLKKAKDFDSVCLYFNQIKYTLEKINVIEKYLNS